MTNTTVDDQIATFQAMGRAAVTMLGGGKPGMTTLTIAEITQRPHDAVLKKARKLLKDIGATVGGLVNFDETPCDAQESTCLDTQGRAHQEKR